VLWLYRIATAIALILANFLSRFVPAIKIFLLEREKAFVDWKTQQIASGALWFHVSSVGELEQVRPVIEALRARSVGPLVLTYYSPSVPRLIQDWSFVDARGFIPLDEQSRMSEFIELIKPRALVLNRYDLWPEMLEQARIHKVPVALVNASIPPLGFLGRMSLYFRKFLFKRISLWTYVDAAAATAWEHYTTQQSVGLVTGNPRVDRALSRAQSRRQEGASPWIIKLQSLAQGRAVIVGGSTWLEDELVLLESLKDIRLKPGLSDVILFLVPHEPSEEHLSALESQIAEFGFNCRRCDPWLDSAMPVDVVIVNIRGILAELYGLGKSAFVGGGFGKQIHSIIEPLAHGIPVAFGPRFERMPEAESLIALGAALVAEHPIKSQANLAQWLADGISGGERTRKVQEALAFFIRLHQGAGERIALFLLEQLGVPWKK
jgi:3-deoxy-D-manno-octulosonic-acid transferase